MSYSLVPYIVDLAKLRAAIGSKDAKLIETIRKKDPEKFDSGKDGLTLGEALSQLVMGEKLGKKAAHQYGYALETLAKHLGKPLPLDLWCGVRWEAMEDSGVARIMESGSPVKLPKIPDFPGIGFLERNKIADMVRKMGDEGLTNEDEELEELLREFEAWVRAAAKAKQDLLLFYY
jgi:hypothetical protein